MHDPQAFEARLGAGLGRYADQVPTDVDVVAFVRATRVAAAPNRSFWRRSSTLRLALLLGLLVALALVAAALVGALPSPRTYADVFTPTGSLAVPRSNHTATLLHDSRVLVIGGYDDSRTDIPTLMSTELWDPGTGSFSAGPALAQSRSRHTATLLPDGRILVVGGLEGGRGNSIAVATAELWDPATGTFGPTGSLLEPREDHTATLLPDGRVLVVGGVDGDSSQGASAEIWDPATGSFTPTGSLDLPRSGYTATALSDGRVLIVGGDVGDQVLASVLSWDLATGSFTPAGSLAHPRCAHTATLLPDGRVLIIGGDSAGQPGGVESAEIWDPATNTTRPAGSLELPRYNHTATLLPDGRVLVVGGQATRFRGPINSTEVWDPATEAFSTVASSSEPRYYDTATLLADGRVLVVGGGLGPSTGTAELYH